jgi:hypothetical protein
MITQGVRSSAEVMSGSDLAREPDLPVPAQRALTFSLLFSAFRCTVQYILLPLILPWVGLAAAVPEWLLAILGVLALAALIKNARLVWRMRHARRWNYMAVATIASAALLVFMAIDVNKLLN